MIGPIYSAPSLPSLALQGPQLPAGPLSPGGALAPGSTLAAAPSHVAGTGKATPSTAAAPAGADFTDMLRQVLGQLNDLAQRADQMATRAAVGEDVDLHQMVVAMEAAGLGFQLTLQVRNKLVEAYQDIIRMQV